jgi:putative serine protease PepD
VSTGGVDACQPAVLAPTAVTILALVAADDDEGDELGFGQPLPPDDRLWRHPSELGAEVTGQRSGVVADTRRASHESRLWGLALVSGLAGAVLATGVVAALGGLGARVVEHQIIERIAVQPKLSAPAGSASADIAALTADVSPAMVRIDVDDNGTMTTGSGVIFRDDGYLLTSGTLIAGASAVAAELYDGRRLQARVIGIDATTDVAVLKIDAHYLPTVLLGSAIDLRVGEPVMAMGCEAGGEVTPTVTTGVISALGRQVATDGQPLHDMIQTDAPIAPGVSGGPLVDAAGAVIGITTAANESATQLGFAIPIDLARRVAEDLIASGKAHHVWLGISGNDLDLHAATAAGVDTGALVRVVSDASPASVAGMRADDIIVAVDGRKVTSMSGVVIALRTHRPGDEVAIDYVRAGKRGTMTVVLVERGS